MEKKIRIIHQKNDPTIIPRHFRKSDNGNSCMSCTAFHINTDTEMAFCIHARGPVYDDIEQASDYVCDAYNVILL
jgi:hypothetical protein